MHDSSNSRESGWFHEWMDAHYARIHRAAFVLTGHAADADDLAQETFLRALGGRNGFAGRSRPETWLYSILLNTHRERCRGNSRLWRRWRDWWNGRGSQVVSVLPENALLEGEWRNTLWAAVAKLPAPQGQAVLLRYAEELSYEEIAEVMNCPIGTVRSRLNSALTTLREQVSPELAIPPSTEESTPCLAR